MAESKIAIQAEIKLTLTAEEAAWLKESLQNAHMRESPHDEHMRRSVWNALPPLQELQELRRKEAGTTCGRSPCNETPQCDEAEDAG